MLVPCLFFCGLMLAISVVRCEPQSAPGKHAKKIQERTGRIVDRVGAIGDRFDAIGERMGL